MSGSSHLAVVGCGAIAESYHLPALAAILDTRERLILVDPSEERLEIMTERFGAVRAVRAHHEVLGSVDGAILAVPHHLHHRLALDFLDAGAHVLCEKPLARTTDEVDELLDAAGRAGRSLSVNNNRRLFPSMLEVRKLLQSGALGEPRRLEFTLGEVFEWPAAGNSYFGPAAGGRGVFLDIGAHVVDLVRWWLDRPLEIESFVDDSHGGTEAVARFSFTAGSCRGEVRLSWLSRLDNGYRIDCEDGAILGGVYDLDRLETEDRTGRRSTIKISGRTPDRDELARRMIRNFVGVVAGEEAPLVPAAEVADSIRTIDACYGRRHRFKMPWLDPDEAFLDV